MQAEKPGRLKRLKAYAEKAREQSVSVRESLDAKEALLARALEENKVLNDLHLLFNLSIPP